MSKNWILILWLSWLMAFALGNGVLAQEHQELTQPKVPLEQLLNRDGTLDLNKGFQGSLDPAGWQMMTGPNGEPRFMPANTVQQTVGAAQLMSVPGDENWDDRFSVNGMNNRVIDLVFDGSGNLYAGGLFTSAGGIAVNRIAKWDGTKWSALGSGIEGTSNVYVYSLAYDENGSIYAGGQFTTAGGVSVKNVAKWDIGSETWSAVGDFYSNFIYDLAVESNGNLYAGGYFGTSIGTARWDRSEWSTLDYGLGSVHAIALDGDGNLYAGGSFNAYGPITANKVAKWDGSSWSGLGSGMSAVGSVMSLTVDGSGNLYVGGWFAPPGYDLASQVAKWDGSTWTRLGSPMDGNWGYGNVNCVAVDGSGNVYAGGAFRMAGAVSVNRIAKWDPISEAWSALGTGMNADVWALAIDENGNLYVGGDFSTAGEVVANRIAKWDGTRWSALGGGNGMNSNIEVLAGDGTGNLYAGGRFIVAGEVSANRIAKWNGTNWSALGSGITINYVNTLAVDGSGNLFAGGSFPAAGGVAANHIAKWDGTSWSGLGSGLNGFVSALAVDNGGNVYAGGNFTTADGVAANHIAKWDGTSWSPLLSGTDVYIKALVVDRNGNLYAGGNFTVAGGDIVNRIAKWDGTSWSALGSGMNSDVNALAVDGSGNLYAGGYFTTAGGVGVNRIAKWNGTSWFPLGSGIDGYVNALAVDGSGNLYAGGYFATAGGLGANCIAKWDGTSWSALGSGTNDRVYAIAVSGSKLFAGGNFTTAGGKPSWYFGSCALNAPPTVAAGGPYVVNEGGSVAVTASGSDPENGALAYAWDLDNNGSFETDGQSVTFSAANIDGPASRTIQVQVTDDGGLTATDQATVNVLNVAPTATFTVKPGTIVVGKSATLAFSSPFDPSAADVAAEFKYSYDGTSDGTFEISDVTATSYPCPYPTSGTFTAKGRIKDKDGGYTDYTVQIVVQTPQEATGSLIDQVQALIDAGVLNGGQGNALISKLEAIIKQLDKGNTTAAINELQAFINQVNDFMDSDPPILTPEEGQPLIDAANAIIAALNNPQVAKAGFQADPSEGLTAVDQTNGSLPTGFQLEQNSPNPFNPVTTIQFSVPRESFVRLKVYNSFGAEVATLVDQRVAAGTYKVTWDASHLATGFYFSRLEAEGFAQTKKLLLMK